MRRLMLSVAMLLLGLGLLGGSIAFLVGKSLAPLDEEVGTHSSAAGAVLGLGLVVAALNPSRGNAWVRAGILYGFVVLVFEVGSYLWLRSSFHLGPVIFGLAFSLLLIATYPQRPRARKISTNDSRGAAAPAPLEPKSEAQDEPVVNEPEKPSS